MTVPLTDAEVRAYVAHQLKLAGTEGTVLTPVFTEEGLQGACHRLARNPATGQHDRRSRPSQRLAARGADHRGGGRPACARRLRQPFEPRRSDGAPVGQGAGSDAPRPTTDGAGSRSTCRSSSCCCGGRGVPVRVDPASPCPAGAEREGLAVRRPPARSSRSQRRCTDLIQPTRTSDAAPSALQNPEPRLPDVPVRPAVLRPPERPVASPETRPAPAVRRPAPDVTLRDREATGEHRRRGPGDAAQPGSGHRRLRPAAPEALARSAAAKRPRR